MELMVQKASGSKTYLFAGTKILPEVITIDNQITCLCSLSTHQLNPHYSQSLVRVEIQKWPKTTDRKDILNALVHDDLRGSEHTSSLAEEEGLGSRDNRGAQGPVTL